MAPYTVYKEKNTANIKTDRVLKLMSHGGVKGKGTLLNTKLFSGEIELHAIQDSGLWHLKYVNTDHKSHNAAGAGPVPEALRQRWTNFNQLMKEVTTYFSMRNIEVTEVIA